MSTTPRSPTRHTLDGFNVLDEIRDAQYPSDLFTPGTSMAARYRDLAKHAHPDRGGDADLFRKLNIFYQRALSGGATKPAAQVIETRRRTYALGERREHGPVVSTWEASWKDDDEVRSGLLRLPLAARDSDLLEAEAAALTAVAAEDEGIAKLYVPRKLDSFRYKTTSGRRRVNVVTRPEGAWYRLNQYRTTPADFLDPKDAAWIWRRLLVVVGLAHEAGWVHGGITPATVLIEPEAHGVHIIDWTTAVPIGGTVPYAVPAWRNITPGEVLAKELAQPDTDIAAVARLMAYMTKLPRRLERFAYACSHPRRSVRPQDAWALIGELDELLEVTWGRRKFHPTPVPGVPAAY